MCHFYVQDERYVTVLWMAKSDDKNKIKGESNGFRTSSTQTSG